MPSLQGRAEKAAAGPSGVATTTSRGRSASGETARRWPNLKKHGPAWHSWGGRFGAGAVPGHGPARLTWPIISKRRPTDCSCYPWTFKPSKALRPLRPGATTNPERWLWTSLLTLKESASSGGPPDFREFPKSIAIRRVNSSRPPPAKSREKPARLGRRVRGLPLVVSSNHLAESVALPPIRGKASCPNLI